MAHFRTLVGLGLASTMMITAPVFASTSTTAKPATHQVASSKHAAPARQARPAKAATTNGKKAAY